MENDKELCPPCLHNAKIKSGASKPPTTQQIPEQDHSLLDDALLSVEENRILIRSKEGWELWRGAITDQTELREILAKAKRIYQIRLRRQKN